MILFQGCLITEKVVNHKQLGLRLHYLLSDMIVRLIQRSL